MAHVVTIIGTRQRQNYTAHAASVIHEVLAAGGTTVETLHGCDLELAFPGDPVTPDAKQLEEKVAAADLVLLATPEYHGTFSAFLKLVIESLGYPSALRGKPVAMLGVAGGRIGATKSLEQLRNTCAHTGALVLPGAVSVALASRVFNDKGTCIDDEARSALTGQGETILSFLHNYVEPQRVLRELIAAGAEVPWSSEGPS